MKLYLFVIISFFVSSCSKDECLRSDFYKKVDLYECNMSNNPDSSSLTLGLIGRWKFIFLTCPQAAGQGYCGEGDSIIVEFKPNGTFFIFERDSLLDSSTWFLQIKDDPLFGIVDTIHSDLLSGRITLCEDEVLFDYSYIDVCEHYFRRIE